MPILKNARWERFAQEIAKGRDADEAYVIAGYRRNKGNASALKARPEVSGRIAEIIGRAAERTGITVERVLTELAKIGFADIRKAVKWKPFVTELEVDEETGEARLAVTNQVQVVASEELDDETAAAIAEVSQTDKGGLRIKLHDKRAALVDIGKQLGMFKEKVEVTGKDGGPIATDNAHHGEVAVSTTAAFIAGAIGAGTEGAPRKPRKG